jgi:hypothetical protein
MTASSVAAKGTMAAATAEVRRRRVFYIPGFDPSPSRRYREMYRREGAAQAAISGHEIALTPRTGGRDGWGVTARIDGAEVTAEVEVLVWSDIVRDRMDHGILATYGQLVGTAWLYLSTGALWRLLRMRKGPAIAIFYPVVHLLVQLILALLIGAAVAFGVTVALPGPVGLALGALTGMAAVWVVLLGFKRLDKRIRAHWLMHDYAYASQHRGAHPAELEARMAEFATRIREALASPVDEVLVVGHSSGAILAVSILSDLIRAGLPVGHPPLAFLSLGQMIPMLSFLPEATRLRRDLHDLSQRAEVTWIDVTAPGDGCCFALCDPVAVSGVAPVTGKLWPLVISCAFSQTLSPERWRAMRWRWFDLHFQYLAAFDRPGDYDYFRITAGPLTLATRYRGRAPSKSRIEEARSGYRSMS